MNSDLLETINKLRKEGKSEKEIAEILDLKTTELRAMFYSLKSQQKHSL